VAMAEEEKEDKEEETCMCSSLACALHLFSSHKLAPVHGLLGQVRD